MELLQLKINVPFWCSFKDFGTVSSHLTYPFPTPSAIFGIILNALGKHAIHYIKDHVDDNKVIDKLTSEYKDAFSKMKFAVIITSEGEKIDDYINIHKRNRGSDNIEKNNTITTELFKYLMYALNIGEEKAKEISSAASKYRLYRDKSITKAVSKQINDSIIIQQIESKTISLWKDEAIRYQLNRFWQKTQVIRQRLITPEYVIYIQSNNDGEYSNSNLYRYLQHPVRPLYLGESDDLVNIDVKFVNDFQPDTIKSSIIDSVVPGILPNSTQVYIPVSLRFQEKTKASKKIFSMPKGKLEKEIECFVYEVHRFVFI